MKILGVGKQLGENCIKNSDIETMMDTNNEWIIQRTGIEQRYWVNDDTSTSDLAYKATQQALSNANLEAKDIDLIIFATLSPDHDFPGAGCFLQSKLGLTSTPALDIRQQCSGFIYGLVIANSFIENGTYENILLVGAEVHSKGLDKTPRGRDVSILFGDGAGAVVLSKTNDKSKKLLASNLHAAGDFAKELWLPAPGCGLSGERMSQAMIDEGLHYPKMNGKKVFVHAVKSMAQSLTKCISDADLKSEDIDLYLFHQANLRINSKVAEVMKIPENKVFNTIQNYGNTTAATIPIGLNDAIEAGLVKEGMKIAFCAFGAGFTWGSVIIEY